MTKIRCSYTTKGFRDNCNDLYPTLCELPVNCGLRVGTSEAGSHPTFQGPSTGPGSDWLGAWDTFHTNPAPTPALHTLLVSRVNTDTGPFPRK